MHHRSEAIILRRVAYGESDWIVSFFSRRYGRLSGMAKSARASRKRFGGAIEPGAIVDVRFSERRGSQLVRLDEAQPLVPVGGSMKSLERIGAVSRSLKLAIAFLQEREVNEAKFDLLRDRIIKLSGSEPDPHDEAAFEVRWLALSGYQPVLCECVACRKGVEAAGGSWRFSFERGGFLCQRCSLGGSPSKLLSDAAVKGLVSISMNRIPEERSHSEAGGAVIRGYIDHVLGKPLTKPIF